MATGATPSTTQRGSASALGATALILGRDRAELAAAAGVDAGAATHVSAAEAGGLQLNHRFGIVVVRTHATDDATHHRNIIHCAVQHLERDGHLVVVHDPHAAPLCDGFRPDDLQAVGEHAIGPSRMSVFRRGQRTTVHDLLYEARAIINRIDAGKLHERMHCSDPPLVLDTRTHTDRARFGVIPGAVHVPRTVVEWHLDPANGYLHPAMTSFDQSIVIVCNGGYSSSLAAANLARIGFTNVADLIGGHAAWCAAGFPVHQPDHSHLSMPVCTGGREATAQLGAVSSG